MRCVCDVRREAGPDAQDGTAPHRDRLARFPWSVGETQQGVHHARVRVCVSPVTTRHPSGESGRRGRMRRHGRRPGYGGPARTPDAHAHAHTPTDGTDGCLREYLFFGYNGTVSVWMFWRVRVR